MKIYNSEIKEHSFPRSEKNIRVFATFRGAQCGVQYISFGYSLYSYLDIAIFYNSISSIILLSRSNLEQKT